MTVRQRILCVGNGFLAEDSAGPRVHEALQGQPLPEGVELVDGGLAGLDLLPLVEGLERAVFVDSVRGFAPPGQPVVLQGTDLQPDPPPEYGHDGGLAYLLAVLPRVLAPPLPELFLIGVEGPADEKTVSLLARACLALVRGNPLPESIAATEARSA